MTNYRRGQWGQYKVKNDLLMNPEEVAAALLAVLDACDRVDRYDPEHGHWISTGEIRGVIDAAIGR